MTGDNDYVPNILKMNPCCDVKVSGSTPMKRVSLEDGVIHILEFEETWYLQKERSVYSK